jgi:hypothetical protein
LPKLNSYFTTLTLKKMGKCYNGILGAFNGLVGTVVGTNWRGLEVMKSRPNKSTHPASQEQLDQRSIFALMSSFLALFRYSIKLGFKASKGGKTPMNNAVAFNLENAVGGSSPDCYIDYPLIKMSKGNLLPAYAPAITPLPQRTVNINWTTHPDAFDPYDDEEREERAMDKLTALIYNPATKLRLRTSHITRAMGTLTIKIPAAFGNTPNHVWIFFVAAKGKAVSSSQYLGTFLAEK